MVMERLINELKEVLLQELKIYKHMLEVTKNKTDVITSGKAKELDNITQIEQTLILNIVKLEDLREGIIENIKKQMNIKDDLNITKLLKKLDKGQREEIEKIRDQLLEILNNIKERNNLNSVLINDSLEYINLNINLLTNAASENTYSDKVKKKNVQQQKSIFDAKV